MIERRSSRATLAAHKIVVPWAIATVLSLLAVVPAFAAATTRHVAPTGVDAGDCAATSAPCATITYALMQAVSGDTVLLAPGEYLEVVLVRLDGITIEGAGPSATTVTGPNQCSGIGTPFAVFGSDVTVRGIGVGGCPEGIVAIGQNLIVEGDLFLETAGIGVSLAGGSATVLDNVFRSHGGVCDRAPGSAVVIGNTFLTQDFGICVNFADATAHHNRITNQPDKGVSISSLGGKADLNDNWWGCNDGPNGPGCATLEPEATVVHSWLQLMPIDAPATLGPGDTMELTFGLVGSTSGEVATEFPSAPVVFSATAGSVVPDSASLINGVATMTFTAPNESGVYTVTAGLDGDTASVTFNAPVAASSRPSPIDAPTAPPTSIGASDEGDRGGSVPLQAIVFLISVSRITIGLMRHVKRV